MADYEEVTSSVEVPKNTGVEGFLQAIKSILKLGRVQGLVIDARGKITYTHFRREDETSDLKVDFESVQPHTIIRNGDVEEWTGQSDSAVVALANLFALMERDHLFPTGIVGGAATWFWDWYTQSTGVAAGTRADLFGIPFLQDRMIEDHVLVLCTGYSRGGALLDTRKSYKLVVPKVKP